MLKLSCEVNECKPLAAGGNHTADGAGGCARRAEVGWCKVHPAWKRLVAAHETTIRGNCFQVLLSDSTCAQVLLSTFTCAPTLSLLNVASTITGLGLIVRKASLR